MSTEEWSAMVDATQGELASYEWGKTLSPGLRTRLVAETDGDRLNNDMVEGRDDDQLYLAWLRS